MKRQDILFVSLIAVISVSVGLLVDFLLHNYREIPIEMGCMSIFWVIMSSLGWTFLIVNVRNSLIKRKMLHTEMDEILSSAILSAEDTNTKLIESVQECSKICPYFAIKNGHAFCTHPGHEVIDKTLGGKELADNPHHIIPTDCPFKKLATPLL